MEDFKKRDLENAIFRNTVANISDGPIFGDPMGDGFSDTQPVDLNWPGDTDDQLKGVQSLVPSPIVTPIAEDTVLPVQPLMEDTEGTLDESAADIKTETRTVQVTQTLRSDDTSGDGDKVAQHIGGGSPDRSTDMSVNTGARSAVIPATETILGMGSSSATAVATDGQTTLPHVIQPMQDDPPNAPFAGASDATLASQAGLPALAEGSFLAPQTVAASSSASALHAGAFSDFEWNILQNLNITSKIGDDMPSGPTISGYNGGGLYEAQEYGKTLASADKKAIALKHRYIQVKSADLLVTDADDHNINAIDYGYYRSENKGVKEYAKWYEYTAIDASNADGYVTYHGITEEYWRHRVWGTVEVKYTFNNIFKGGDYGNHIVGGFGSDTLIGGLGDDIIKANGGGNNRLYGVGGNNSLYGSDDGGDYFFGGTGNDYINTGKGNNRIVLQAGDNLVIAPQNAIEDGKTKTYNNKFVAGSGSDTFVIGNIPAAVTSVESFGYNGMDIMGSAGETVGEKVIEFGMDAVALNPIAGFMTSGLLSMLGSLFGGTPADTVTETSWDTYNVSTIYNFNPVTDRLLLPLNPDGDKNLQIDVSNSAADDYAFQVIDKSGDGWSTKLEVSFGSGKAIFGDWYTQDALSFDHQFAFAEALQRNAFTADANQVHYAGTDISSGELEAVEDFTNSLSEELGSGRYAVAGAWSGSFIQGLESTKYIMGTAHSDILFGYNMTTDLDPTGDARIYYGFDGDNLFGPAFADNTIVGGNGNNTITYQYYGSDTLGDATMPGSVYIEADMRESLSLDKYVVKDTGVDWYGKYYQIHTYSSEDSHIDKVFQVQNIVGSQGNDTLIGNYEANTFYSTGSTSDGYNTWSGTGGSNTFYMNGGSSRITDFSGADTLVLNKLSYVDKSVNYAANLRWEDRGDAWTLYDRKSDLDVVTLEHNDYLDSPPEVTIIMNDGTEKDYMPASDSYVESSTNFFLF